jgi:hypothetical protein
MLPGIKQLQIADARDMSSFGDLSPGATLYNIQFRQWSGSFSQSHGSSQAGDYYTLKAECYVPRMRFMTEHIISELMDRKVVVFVIDKNGEQHRINWASFSSNGGTGAGPSESNGYRWTFTGRDRRKPFFADFTVIDLTGNENVVPGPDVPDLEPNPGPESTDTGCCITILTTPVAEAPPASGNILNRNKFVRMDNGRQFFIDKNGLSIEIGGGTTEYELITGTGLSTYTITMDMTDFGPEKFIISRNGVVMVADPTLIPINSFMVDGQDITLALPLETDEIIQIYRI